MFFFFFTIIGIFHKTLNLALEVLDQSQAKVPKIIIEDNIIKLLSALSPVPKSIQFYCKHELN